MADDTHMAPGDEVPADAGAPIGDAVCPDCSGSGQVEGKACATCEGGGTVIQAVGGA